MPLLDEMGARGHDIQIGVLDDGSHPTTTHRLSTDNMARSGRVWRRVTSSLGRLLVRLALPLASQRVRTYLAARFDPWFRSTITGADVVLLFDEEILVARPLIEQWNPRARLRTGLLAIRALEEQRYWIALMAALAEGARDDSPPPRSVSAVLDAIERSVAAVSEEPVLRPQNLAKELLAFVHGLVARGRGEEALSILIAAAELPGENPTSNGLEAFRLAADLTVNGHRPGDFTEAVAGALESADAALAGGEIDHALDLVTAALGLMFHRDLHADESLTPLVETPSTFLAPLRGDVMDALRSTLPAAPTVRRAETDHRHIVVLPGSFGRFAVPVIEALDAQPATTVEVLNLAEQHGVYRGLGVSRAVIELRLGQTLGERGRRPGPVDVLDRADVVFVDWADKGAIWASLFLPRGTRLVIRVHSIDTLSVWIHLIDWSRVDEIIFVGAHVQEFVLEMLGQRVSHVQSHVVPNVVDVDRYTASTPPGAERTLAMVGWGQRVKDPLWAVEVLRSLLRQDPDWRLLLIGADFAAERSVVSRAYAEEFRRQVRADDVRRSIEYVGQTSDVPVHLLRAGYVLSTSVREAFHLAVVEGVAGGAVPVVRNWPMFAGRGGARSVYPSEWVVETPEDAVERILHTSTERLEAARRAHTEIQARFDPDGARAELVRIIVGSPPGS